VGEDSTQPCALTTKVSQSSEKGAAGSRLVTTIGRVIGTLELRRTALPEFALCIVIPLSKSQPLRAHTGSKSAPNKVTQGPALGPFQ
jgi:hypothetical protein